LLATQAERKVSADSDPSLRKLGPLKFVDGGDVPLAETTDDPEAPTTGIVPETPRPDVDNKMAIEDDLGPFNLVAPKKLESLGPVLVILPESGGVDIVLIELSPVDVCCREKLRVDEHSMTCLSAVPSFEDMRLRGSNFQFHSSKKDYVSDSFAVLHGATNSTVATVMDEVMPSAHNCSAHFKLLARHREHQVNRDSGNKAGGDGKGCRIDLGACDHNYDGENYSGMTGDQELDSSREPLRNYFGSLMDAVLVIVDRVREDHCCKRIYDDHTREESFASKLRDEVGAACSRAEVSSNFVTLMDGKDGCSFHTDKKNCPESSYDWTCCVATTVESESTGRLHRAVTNLNSRAACGRAMDSETEFATFRLGLETEMKRIDTSYQELCGDGPSVPTAQTFTELCLSEDLPWETDTDGQGFVLRCCRAASAPSRDFFLSTAASAVCNLRLKGEGIGCHTMVGMLLIAMHMGTYQHLCAIGLTIKGQPGLFERMRTDLPGTHWEISEPLHPGKFWAGKHHRFSPSGLDFHQVFVKNKTNFNGAVGELKELLKLVNATLHRATVTAKTKELVDSSKLPGLNVFRLQLFIPLAALCGLVLADSLFHADCIEPAEGVENGSYSALTTAGFAMHRHSSTLLNICGQIGLPRRHSLGGCLTCENHRRNKRFDLFMHGQDLFYLFLNDTGYSVQRKRFNSTDWESVTMITKTILDSEDFA
jgi:hypothetical protein